MLLRALILMLITSAQANTFTHADVEGFEAFDQKILVLINDIPKGSTASDCVTVLTDTLYSAGLEIEAIEGLVGLETVMVDPADDFRVKLLLRLRLSAFLKTLAKDRTDINQTMGHCASVAVKGQAVLSLFDEASTLVQAISEKISSR
jgi:hypothetical protein